MTSEERLSKVIGMAREYAEMKKHSTSYEKETISLLRDKLEEKAELEIEEVKAFNYINYTLDKIDMELSVLLKEIDKL